MGCGASTVSGRDADASAAEPQARNGKARLGVTQRRMSLETTLKRTRSASISNMHPPDPAKVACDVSPEEAETGCFYHVSVSLNAAKKLPRADWTQLSDPYVVVTCGNHSLRTGTVMRTLNPVFNERLDFLVSELPTHISLRIMDYDLASRDDFMCQATIPVMESEFGSWSPFRWVQLHNARNRRSGRIQVQVNVTFLQADRNTPQQDQVRYVRSVGVVAFHLDRIRFRAGAARAIRSLSGASVRNGMARLFLVVSHGSATFRSRVVPVPVASVRDGAEVNVGKVVRVWVRVGQEKYIDGVFLYAERGPPAAPEEKGRQPRKDWDVDRPARAPLLLGVGHISLPMALDGNRHRLPVALESQGNNPLGDNSIQKLLSRRSGMTDTQLVSPVEGDYRHLTVRAESEQHLDLPGTSRRDGGTIQAARAGPDASTPASAQAQVRVEVRVEVEQEQGPSAGEAVDMWALYDLAAEEDTTMLDMAVEQEVAALERIAQAAGEDSGSVWTSETEGKGGDSEGDYNGEGEDGPDERAEDEEDEEEDQDEEGGANGNEEEANAAPASQEESSNVPARSGAGANGTEAATGVAAMPSPPSRGQSSSRDAESRRSSACPAVEHHLTAQEEASAAAIVDVHTRFLPKNDLERLFFARLLNVCDTNGDGRLSYEEFLVVLSTIGQSIGRELQEDEAADLFQRLDADRSGHLEQEELLRFLRSAEFQTRPMSYEMLAFVLDGPGGVDNAISGFVSDLHESRKNRKGATIARVQHGASVLADTNSLFARDRETGILLREHVPKYVRTALGLLYRGVLGAGLVKLGGVRAILWSMSAREGAHRNSPASAASIPEFVEQYGIDTTELARPLSEFRTFNEFFYRRLRPGVRPVAEPENDAVAVSPADCRLMVFPTVMDATSIWIKGSRFTVEKLFGGNRGTSSVARRFVGGSVLIARLAPQDYHRWHMPVTGTLREPVPIPGCLYTVNPIAIRQNIDVFTENKRVLCMVHTEAFGLVAMVAVGATMVGSVNITGQTGATLQKGDEHGYFAFGGSTVLVLFQPGRIAFDHDLLGNSQHGLETVVKVGMRVGVATRAATVAAAAAEATDSPPPAAPSPTGGQ